MFNKKRFAIFFVWGDPPFSDPNRAPRGVLRPQLPLRRKFLANKNSGEISLVLKGTSPSFLPSSTPWYKQGVLEGKIWGTFFAQTNFCEVFYFEKKWRARPPRVPDSLHTDAHTHRQSWAFLILIVTPNVCTDWQYS